MSRSVLSRAHGMVRQRSRSLLIENREAHLILLEFTNHYQCFALSGSRFAPVCAAKEGDLFIEAQPPLLENGGEWARLDTNPFPFTPRRNLWDSSVVTKYLV